jgi:hypothetical protein
MSNDGLVTLKSNHAVKDTIHRFDAGLAGKGISVFARIDHAAGAALIDMPLRPTFLLIFGSRQRRYTAHAGQGQDPRASRTQFILRESARRGRRHQWFSRGKALSGAYGASDSARRGSLRRHGEALRRRSYAKRLSFASGPMAVTSASNPATQAIKIAIVWA